MCLKNPRIIRKISESSVNFPKRCVVKLLNSSRGHQAEQAEDLERLAWRFQVKQVEPSQKVKWISVLIETNWQSTGAMLKASIKIIIAILVIL